MTILTNTLFCQLIFKEWSDGQNETQAAQSIQKKFGFSSINEEEVSALFSIFASNEKSFKVSMIPEPCVEALLNTNKSMLFSSNERSALKTANNGRVAIIPTYSNYKNWTFALYDLLHGLKRYD